MVRQWRIGYPGALYHVLSRGNNRQNIFESDDELYFYETLILKQLYNLYQIEKREGYPKTISNLRNPVRILFQSKGIA